MARRSSLVLQRRPSNAIVPLLADANNGRPNTTITHVQPWNILISFIDITFLAGKTWLATVHTKYRNIDVLMRGSRVETGTSFGATLIECYQRSCLVYHLFPCQKMFLHAPRRSFVATCSMRSQSIEKRNCSLNVR